MTDQPRDIAIVHADDWLGLYVDGHLVYEGHSMTESMVLEFLDIPHKNIHAEKQLLDLGGCPQELSDVEADPS